MADYTYRHFPLMSVCFSRGHAISHLCALSGVIANEMMVRYPPVSLHWGQIQIQCRSTTSHKELKFATAGQNKGHGSITDRKFQKGVFLSRCSSSLSLTFLFPRTKEDHSDC